MSTELLGPEGVLGNEHELGIVSIDRHRVSLGILAVFFVVVATTNLSPATLKSGSPPEKMVINVGAAMGPRFKVELVGDEIVYQSGDYGPDGKIIEEHVRPTPEQWDKFWGVMEEIRLGRWAENYNAPNVICGYTWYVHIEKDGQIYTSQGSNSYPSDEDPGKGNHSESKVKQPYGISKQSQLFHQFLTAVSALVGNLPFR